MLAALDRGHMARFGRLIAALAAGALPVLIVATAAGTAAAADSAAAAGCKPGSGPHLAGRRITASEVARYQGTSGLQCADLARANLSGLRLIQFDLTKANLRHANLSHANLTQATLTGAAMQGANLRSADLTQATMDHVNLAGADLRKANLEQVEAKGANFRKANLTDADLSEATLTSAHFNGAKLNGASFAGATGGPAGQSGGPAGQSGGTSTVSVSKKNVHEYLLGGAALIFVLMSLGSVRRYFYTRTGSFLRAPGAGYGGFVGPWGGRDASGYGGQPTPTTPFTPTPAAPYGPMPSAFVGRWRGTGRPARLALAILGALVVAIALWLIGTTVVEAILVPAGKTGLRLCESSCGSRFGGHTPVGLVAGVILLAFGGTLRAIGRIRY